ncbi:MAG TPA: hypothetical protein PKY81_12130 [bacterium]|nr:hypothetical protein [bacterium]
MQKYVCVDELSEYFLQNAQSENITDFFYFFEILKKNNFLDTAIFSDNELFAEYRTMVEDAEIVFKIIGDSKKYVLSEFAYFRNSENQIILESPLAFSKIILHNHLCAAILFLLSKPVDIETIHKNVGLLNIEIIKMFLNMLFTNNFISEYCENQKDDNILKQWEFHDLLFHTLSSRRTAINPKIQ